MTLEDLIYKRMTEDTSLKAALYAFPLQTTTDPDPVLAMNHYIEQLIPEAKVIDGIKPLEQIFTPQQETPAFYFRLETIQTQRETNTVAWMDATVACHIFAGGEETTWLKYLVDALAVAGEVIMLDTSPMFLQNLIEEVEMDEETTQNTLRTYENDILSVLFCPVAEYPCEVVHSFICHIFASFM